MSLPLASNGGTVLHLAFKKAQFEILDQMIMEGGNPFVEDEEGQSIEMLVQGMSDDNEFKSRLIESIEIFFERHPRRDKEGLVHSAVRQNNLLKVKILKFLNGRFDTFNNFKQLPIDIAMENNSLEMFLYLLSETDELDRTNPVSQKCQMFLADKIDEKAFTADLAIKYKPVLQKIWLQGISAEDFEARTENLAKCSDEDVNDLLSLLLTESKSLETNESIDDQNLIKEVVNEAGVAELNYCQLASGEMREDIDLMQFENDANGTCVSVLQPPVDETAI